MDRRPLRLHMACLAVLLIAVAPATKAAEPVVLQDSQVLLAVDSAYGAITRVLDKPSGIALEPPQGMAESFRLVLLKPDKKTTTILGRNQKLTSHALEGARLTLAWDGPLEDTEGTEHSLAVRLVADASGGALSFTLGLTNNTGHKVQEAWYPIIGGLTKFAKPGAQPDAVAWAPTSNPWEKPLKLPFENAAFGYPGHLNMSFTCVQSKSARRSLYFAAQDPIARHKVYHLMEVAGTSAKDVFACIHHSPFTPPGKTFNGSPVVLRFIDGDWRAAGRVYRDWFEKTFGIAEPSDRGNWIRRQSFFLMTMFMLPEGTISYTFKDIPKWARAAKEHGINAVQISGWQMGGHDNGYPHYTPDPRLGTTKELEDGIRYCHKLGLKVFFFVNYQPMMLDSDWYKNELQKYREMTADGGLTWNAGWGMGTLWARMGHPKLMTWANLAFPEFRKIIVDYFADLARIGADGVHVDKMFPAGLDYNPDSPLPPDTATWEGAVMLTKEVMAACRKLNSDWAMSFECNWDRMLQFGGATWWVGNQLITREVFPEHVETLGLYQAYDYLGVNNAVRNGHAVMVAPLNFSRGFEWPPFAGLADYIKEVKRIQDSLQETVFLGEVLGRDGVTLKSGPGQGIDYNAFRNTRTGLRACIFTNSSAEPARQAIQAFAGSRSTRVRVHVPFARSRILRLPAEVEVPAERIAFVEELGGGR